MDLLSLKNIKSLLRKNKIVPSLSLGQHFLVNKKVLKKIIKASNLTKKDIVLEIGAGLGSLTQALAKKVKKVIAVEKDKRLVSLLKENLKDFDNIKIIERDIIKLLNSNLKSQKTNLHLKSQNYKVIGNIPYYFTSRLIRLLLELKEPPKSIILTIQKEVAQRICKKPPKMNLLAISVQFYAKTKIIDFVSKNAFWPQPKVESAIIKLKTTTKNLKLKINQKIFFQIVKAGFSQPRKKLLNNLSKKLKIDKKNVLKLLKRCKIKENTRAENLNLKDWFCLCKIIKQ